MGCTILPVFRSSGCTPRDGPGGDSCLTPRGAAAVTLYVPASGVRCARPSTFPPALVIGGFSPCFVFCFFLTVAVLMCEGVLPLRVWLERQERILAGCRLNAIRFCAPRGPPAPPFHARRPPLSGGLRRPPARAPLLCPFSGSGVPIRAGWQTMERVAPGGFALASASAEPGAPLKRPQLSAPLSPGWCRRELPWRLLPLASQGEAGFGRWLVSGSGRGAWGTSSGV